MSNDNTDLKRQGPPAVFCGMDALIHRLSALKIRTEDQHINNEISEVVVELHLLDNGLYRLRHERSWVDEHDLDLAIDRFRSIQKRGTQ